MRKGKILLYTYDPYLAEAISHITHRFRDFTGSLRLPHDIAIIDNRISNHAMRAISELTVARRQPVIWLTFEHFYAYKPKTTDFFIDGRASPKEIADSLAEAVYLRARNKPAPINYYTTHERPKLSRRELLALSLSLNEKNPGLPSCARRLERSVKTLYAQRVTAVRKLGFCSFREFSAWIAGKEGRSLNINLFLRCVYPPQTIAIAYSTDCAAVPYKRITDDNAVNCIVVWGGGSHIHYDLRLPHIEQLT